MATSLAETIRRAGVVGAGGAGFPAYVKASARADTVIINAAECEPLLQKDREILAHFAPDVARGLRLLVEAVGAKRGVIAVKAKHADLAALVERALAGQSGLSVHRLDDYYPAGDEFCQVFEVAGRLIPPGGLPIQVGVVVNNVETAYNIARASASPVVDTFLTVAGAVKSPRTLRLPIGTPLSQALDLAGGAAVKDFAVLEGGAMMGRLAEDLSRPLTKTSAGLIVLPKEHPLVRRKAAGRPARERRGRSACDQCCLCTELCPRYLLGYPVQPHKVMRGLLFAAPERRAWSPWGLLCSECKLCSLFSCPEELDPGDVCAGVKADFCAQARGGKDSPLTAGAEPRPHPVRPWRKIPTAQLKERLGLTRYEAEAPLRQEPYAPPVVRILLKQHAGAPARPVVSVGRPVHRGELIADVAPDELGVPLHASIDGRVTAIEDFVEISAG
ncbi:MAG: SLBB domain-containing protein [Elusimicrobia bacterium]|nr:SLBB domain-containing protein [Elusimicrobiota bacterium]